MPYLLRLEMERTRRRIRDYLCAVFSGYRFDPKDPEWIASRLKDCNGARSGPLRREQPLQGRLGGLDKEKTAHERMVLQQQRSRRRLYAGAWPARLVPRLAMAGPAPASPITTSTICGGSSPEVRLPEHGVPRTLRHLPGKPPHQAQCQAAPQAPGTRTGEGRQGNGLPASRPAEEHPYSRNPRSCSCLAPPTQGLPLPSVWGYTTNPVDAGRFTRDELKGWGIVERHHFGERVQVIIAR